MTATPDAPTPSAVPAPSTTPTDFPARRAPKAPRAGAVRWSPGGARRASAAVAAGAAAGDPVEAVTYCRVSKEEQRLQGLSLPAQLEDCLRYVGGQTERHGWLPGPAFQDVMQGWRDGRPQYQQMLAYVRDRLSQRRPTVVVVATLDRLGRRLIESIACREELAMLGAECHSAREGGRLEGIAANVLASVAQHESDRLSLRMSAAAQHLVRGGWHSWGRRPFGYALREASPEERATGAGRSVLEPDPISAPAAREAFERLAAGQGLRSVGRWLASLPEDIRRGAGGGNRGAGRAFGTFAMHCMVRSPTYAGWTPPDAEGVTHQGRWEPLVPFEVWQQAQDALDRHQRLPAQASKRHLLTGMAFCPQCGGRMCGNAKVSRGRQGRYVCIGADSGATAADLNCQFSVIAGQVEAAVLEAAATAVAPLDRPTPAERRALERAWDKVRRPARQAAEGRAGALRRAEDRRDAARREMAAAAVALVRGQMDQTGYGLAKQVFERDLASAETELGRLRQEATAAGEADGAAQELPPLAEVLREASGWGTILKGTDTGAAREVLALLVRRVVPVRIGRGTYETKIEEWTPLGAALAALAAGGAGV